MPGAVVHVVLVTAPDMRTAGKLARLLVADKLAACVNCVPGIISHYAWKGKACRDREVLLLIKTRSGLLGRLAAAVKKNHPYELPEIIALPVVGGDASYLAWIAQSTR